ncbi:protein terminal ear1-like [Macadamia integrifolia]|uniref:protein terminal ear1-like n=1 Tax=Macadamia integrifolia TaxID=60698 RepID=UPI001C4FE593|nr:protein terminal ear1-like [Macadamia integrifolia]
MDPQSQAGTSNLMPFHNGSMGYLMPPPTAPPTSPTPTRSLFLTLVPTHVSEMRVRVDLQVFGPVWSIEMKRLTEGIVTVHFYDERDSKAAFEAIRQQHKQYQKRLTEHYTTLGWLVAPPMPQLTDGLIDGMAIWAEFSVHGISARYDHGSLIVTNLDSKVSSRMVKEMFEGFGGPVKELREASLNSHQWFVEFFDIRDALDALKGLDGQKFHKKRLNIRFSTFPEGHGRRYEHFLINKEIRDTRTTIMIKNLRNRLTTKLLLDVLDNHCLRCNEKIADDQPWSSYDFLYLAVDFRTKLNRGFGFVNFTSPYAVIRFYEAFHNKQSDIFKSNKNGEICYARLQGLEELKGRFQNSEFRCDMDEFLPAVFSPPRDGNQVTQPLTIGCKTNLAEAGDDE